MKYFLLPVQNLHGNKKAAFGDHTLRGSIFAACAEPDLQ